MSDLFLHVFNIAVTAGWIVLAALALRLILRRRLPGWVKVALWGVVGARLLFPFSLESVLSLIPSAEPVPPTITTAPNPTVNVGVPVVDQVINPVISQTMAPAPEASVNPMQVVVFVASVVWLVGTAAMLIYYTVCALRLRRRLAVNLPYGGNVYLCDSLPTPILVGVFRPRIYIPSKTDPSLFPYVLAHEGNHLKRGDHIWKPLGFLLLSVYWFHPLLWVAYALLGRDMEQACDEKTVNELGEDKVRSYARALVACREQKPSHNLPGPVGFGETKIFERVKHMMNYKKPKLWVTVIAVALIAATAVCFLTNPVSAKEPDEPITPPNTQETTGTEQPTGSPTEQPTEQPTEEVTTGAVLSFEDQLKQDLRRTGFNTKYADEELSFIFFVKNDDFCAFFVERTAGYSGDPITYTVGGIDFHYANYQRILVGQNGNIARLEDAYKKQWIDQSELQAIYDGYLAVYPERKDPIRKEYPIAEPVGGPLSEEMQATIAAAMKAKTGYAWTYKLQQGATYYGKFGNSYVVMDTPDSYAAVITTNTYFGYAFTCSRPFDLYVYCDGEIYTLTEAVNAGKISMDDLQKIHEFHTTYNWKHADAFV